MRQYPKWYAVHTWPQHEAMADLNLRRKGFLTFYPFARIKTRRKIPNRDHHRICWIERPYFSRYLFAGLWPDQAIGEVNETHGVSTIVYLGEAPLEIPHPVMDELMARADSGGLVVCADEVSRAPRYVRGQRVRMADNNPFSGMVGEIILDAGSEIKLLFDLLRARVPMTVPPSMVGEILE